MNGVLVIEKPPGWTSHDVVARLRTITGERSIGHLGTLDPMATGVLPLVLGKFTRLAQFYTTAEKQYEGTICLGIETDTYDADGDPIGPPRDCNLPLDAVIAAAQKFVGKIQQVPPPFSAKKIRGVPAYKLARRNKSVELNASEVEVMQFKISQESAPEAAGLASSLTTRHNICYRTLAPEGAEAGCRIVRFEAVVSSGTYIRSLAHDLGRELGCGAHLASLRRSKSGEFTLSQAVTLDQVEAAKTDLAALLIPARQLLPQMPAVNAADEALARIRHGNAVNLPEFSQSKLVKVFAGQALVAIAVRVAGTLFQPKIVLADQ